MSSRSQWFMPKVVAAIVLILVIVGLGHNYDSPWAPSEVSKPVEEVKFDKAPPSTTQNVPGLSETNSNLKPSEKPGKPERPAEKPAEKPTEKPTEKPSETPSPPTPVSSKSSDSEAELDLVDLFFKNVQKPSIKPDTTHYQPYGAFPYELQSEPHFTKPMGEDLCIIDIDNRPFNQSGQAFGDRMSWDFSGEVHGLSTGVLNHWAYAKIHGYKYYFVTFDEPKDRRQSWEKPSIIHKILQRHKTCVYLDSDAIFFHLDLPMEWLMNYWGIDPTNDSLSLSYDPPMDHNKDKFGNYYLNTGFIIHQNHEQNKVAFDVLTSWDDCTNPAGQHPDCEEFSWPADFGRPTDQGGFGTFIRYDYPENIKALPCAEANGFPEDPSPCKGSFIRHMWSGKDTLLKIYTGHQFPGKFMESLHKRFLSDKKNFYWTKRDLMAKVW